MMMYVWKTISGVPNIGITKKKFNRTHGRSREIRKIEQDSPVKTKTICSAPLEVMQPIRHQPMVQTPHGGGSH